MATWAVKWAIAVGMLGAGWSAHAAEPVCKSLPAGEMESKTLCVYAKHTPEQAYQAWRQSIDGGQLLRRTFPNQAVTDTLPDNNPDGLLQVVYTPKNGVWMLELGYQGGETAVSIRKKGDGVEVLSTMSAD